MRPGDPENGNGRTYLTVHWFNNVLLYFFAAIIIGGISLLLGTVNQIDNRLESLERAQALATWTAADALKQQGYIQTDWENRYKLIDDRVIRLQAQEDEIRRTLGIQEDWISAHVHADLAVKESQAARKGGKSGKW